VFERADLLGHTEPECLMTRRADPQPGDEARVVLMQNWLAARPPKSITRQ